MADDVVLVNFRALVESADQKFAKIRDIPLYGRTHSSYFHKVFKSYTKLWKYQQKNRRKLVESGLQRWEIGEIASRIGQLYFSQYMRTSEVRFLFESYMFYEAILNRGYFGGSIKDRGVRFKELRFYARFLLVSIVLNRPEMVELLVERFEALVDDCIAIFRENNFKEWKLVAQEFVQFMKANTAFINLRSLRYCAMFDSYPASLRYVERFYPSKVLNFQDAVLTSYHQNEVKFAELTLDTFRMLQCLEWEPSGSFYQKRQVESYDNGGLVDCSATSGLIDINLAADITNPNLPLNPRKAVLYHPSAMQLISVIASLCDELPPDSVMLLYISASGKAHQRKVSQIEKSGVSRKKSSMTKVVSQYPDGERNYLPENVVDDAGDLSHYYEDSLWLGPCKNEGSNNLYPADLVPFTRRPIFLIIDSNCSHAFKALHGVERGEAAALLLSPLRTLFRGAEATQNGSQFTLFLTTPLQAFCQLIGLTCSNNDRDLYNGADKILSTSFSDWEVTLCNSPTLDLVWAQVFSDPFLRRIILRFIFCRAALTLFCTYEDSDQYLPVCLPQLPDSVSPYCELVQSAVSQLASHLNVIDYFHFNDK